mgnify:CR=1 FL=1
MKHTMLVLGIIQDRPTFYTLSYFLIFTFLQLSNTFLALLVIPCYIPAHQSIRFLIGLDTLIYQKDPPLVPYFHGISRCVEITILGYVLLEHPHMITCFKE